VQYQSGQFLDKNKDYVAPEHQDLLSASKCPFVVDLFPPVAEESTKSSSKSSKFSSIGSRFKLQLQSLMETLNSTEPHYIRCVKPNNLLKPAIFENVNIVQQLRCGIGKTKVFLRAGQMAELDADRALKLTVTDVTDGPLSVVRLISCGHHGRADGSRAPLGPSDAASGPISPMDVRRSCDDNDCNDIL
ncbi:hypothetical protein FXO38_12487, partial [Capsicum annuum]